MSLKAKIEAVIYASEDPVTLAQLVGLLGHEAQRELEVLAARQQSLPLSESDAAVPPEEPEPASLPQAEVQSAMPFDDPASTADKKVAREAERRVRDFLAATVQSLLSDYANSDRGLEIREVAGGFRIGTKPEYHDAVRGFVKSLKPVLKLSLQALESLAVVAYKQPITAPEISEIRGVDSGGVLGSLLARKLITTAGRKQVVGRPILYKTTKDFLLRFGLKDVSELPSIEEFEKMAGELTAQEEIPMPESAQEQAEERITRENFLEQRDATAAQADGDSHSLDADDSHRPDEELPAVDGRLSGLPPASPQPGDDPSAEEAAIQSGESEVR